MPCAGRVQCSYSAPSGPTRPQLARHCAPAAATTACVDRVMSMLQRWHRTASEDAQQVQHRWPSACTQLQDRWRKPLRAGRPLQAIRAPRAMRPHTMQVSSDGISCTRDDRGLPSQDDMQSQAPARVQNSSLSACNWWHLGTPGYPVFHLT